MKKPAKKKTTKQKVALLLRPSPPKVVSGEVVPRSEISIPAAVRTAIAAFETAIGGRRALIEALACADSDPAVVAVLQHLGDPRYDHTPLATVCADFGISPGMLFKAFEVAAIARAHVLALLEAANRIPAVTKEIFDTALTHDQTCAVCAGTTTIVAEPTKAVPNPEPARCSHCHGKGTIRIDGSLEHQKLALEMTGLTKKAGTAIAVNTQINQPSTTFAPGSLESLQQAIGEVLFRPRLAPIPAIVTPADPDASH